MAVKEELYQAVVEGNRSRAGELVQEALTAGIGAEELLYETLIPAMSEVGSRYERGEYYIPEMLIAARAMQAGLDILRPLLAETAREPVARVVLGTVKGDLHDIGKNLVGMMMEGAGFQVTDLGVDVDSDHFVQAVRKDDAQIVGMSALLTTTRPAMKETIEALQAAGLRDSVKILVGGAALDQAYADRIGADAYCDNASVGVREAKRLLGEG